MVPVFPVLLFCLFLLHFESVSWDVCGRGTVPPCRECLFTAAANPALPTAPCGVSLGLATSGCVSGPSKPVSLHTSWSLCCGSRLTVMCQQQSQVTGLSPPELKSTTALPLSGCPFLLVGVFNHTLVSTGESSVTHSPQPLTPQVRHTCSCHPHPEASGYISVFPPARPACTCFHSTHCLGRPCGFLCPSSSCQAALKIMSFLALPPSSWGAVFCSPWGFIIIIYL